MAPSAPAPALASVCVPGAPPGREMNPLGIPADARLGAGVVTEQRERVLGMCLVEDGDERPVPAPPREQLRHLDRAEVRRLVRLEMEVGLVQAVEASPERLHWRTVASG